MLAASQWWRSSPRRLWGYGGLKVTGLGLRIKGLRFTVEGAACVDCQYFMKQEWSLHLFPVITHYRPYIPHNQDPFIFLAIKQKHHVERAPACGSAGVYRIWGLGYRVWGEGSRI